MMDQETIGTGMINQMIDAIFIVEEAQARGITVTEQDVDDYYYGLFGYYPNGVPTTTPDDGTETADEPLPTSISEEEFNSSISAYMDNLKQYNIDEAFIRELVRETLYRDQLIADLEKDIAPEEEQVWARHILLEDEATALDVLDQLENGADFAEMAAEYSIGPSAPTGGDLGWFSRGVMVQAFEDAAFSGEVGDIIGPVQTEFGFHIIQILGKEMRPVDESTLSSLVNTALSGILDEYLANAQIDYADNWIEYTPSDPNISDILQGN
ncbi:peptidylprolyl isomerase [bacterium]|nr:peptidylprolyl isomerase [bacterium]